MFSVTNTPTPPQQHEFTIQPWSLVMDESDLSPGKVRGFLSHPNLLYADSRKKIMCGICNKVFW